MLVHVGFRYFVLLAMTLTFLIIVGNSNFKFRERSIGETQQTKKASEMYFPSLALCPLFNPNYTVQGTKNLTEYYLKKNAIKDHVLSIYQSYITKDGCV